MEESGIFGCVTLLCFIALFVGLGFSLSKSLSKVGPSAMDVYQGKTILEYKVVDGVKVNSCVIWKSRSNE